MSTPTLNQRTDRERGAPAVSLTEHDVPASRVRPRRIRVLGASLDVGNRGVLALGVSLARLLARLAPGSEIHYLYGHQQGGRKELAGTGAAVTVEVLHCRMSPRSAARDHMLVILGLALLHRAGLRVPAERNPWLGSLLSADVIGDIRGGDSFSDIYGLRRFIEGSLPLVSAALLGRPYTLLPQTFGPFKSRVARALARVLLRRASAIYTRDRNCVALVEELCGRTPVVCPDVAFTLEPSEPAALTLTPAGLSLDGDAPVIGLNVSGLLYTGGYTGRNMFGLRSEYASLIDALVEQLLVSTRARILLVPHVFGSEHEEEASAAILAAAGARHPGRVFALADPLTERELKWLIGRTSFFVGSRMHACIAALSQAVPAVGLAYSDKFLGVFESAGVGEAIADLRTVGQDDVLARTLVAFDRRDETRAQLSQLMPQVQREVHQAFRSILSGDAAV